MPKLSNTQKAIIALVIANTIWGAAAPIFKWSLLTTPPFTLALLRFSLAALILFPFVKSKIKVKTKDFLPLVILSICGVTINISFFFLGLEYADSINAPIIISSSPLFIILFGFLFLKDKLRKKTVIGGLLGLVGVLAIIVIPAIGQGFDASVMGNIFFVLSMFGSVVHALLLKKIIKRYNPLTIVFWSFVIGSVGFLPMFFSEVQAVGFLPILNTQLLVGVLFGAILSSALAYTLQTYALKKMPVEDVGIFTYMDPIIAVLIAYPLLGEVPTLYFFMGSLLVFMGIFIAENRIHWHPLHKL